MTFLRGQGRQYRLDGMSDLTLPGFLWYSLVFAYVWLCGSHNFEGCSLSLGCLFCWDPFCLCPCLFLAWEVLAEKKKEKAGRQEQEGRSQEGRKKGLKDCICTFTLTYVHIHIYNTHKPTHIHIHTHIHTYIYTYTYPYIYICVCMYTYTHEYTHTYTFTFALTHVHVHVALTHSFTFQVH